MSDETPSSKIPYWHIANWPFYLRCSVAYLTCAFISASFFVLTFMVNKNTGSFFTIAQSTLIASYLIAFWGTLLFVPATAIAEFFEIRNIGYYLLFGTLNSHVLLIYVTSRISGKAANVTAVFEYLTSLLALLVCIAGVVLGCIYWWMAGRFARRSFWFGELVPHPEIERVKTKPRVY